MTQGERKEEMMRAKEGARSNKRADSDVEGARVACRVHPESPQQPHWVCTRSIQQGSRPGERRAADPQKRMSWFRYKEVWQVYGSAS
jgi:hypothetical protein